MIVWIVMVLVWWLLLWLISVVSLIGMLDIVSCDVVLVFDLVSFGVGN